MNTQTIIFFLIIAIIFYIILRKNKNKISLQNIIFLGIMSYGGYYFSDTVFFEPNLTEQSHGYSTELLSEPYPMSSSSY
jgi:hypothetical protein